MIKRVKHATIMTPEVRLLNVDLTATAKFVDKKTGETKDSGWYSVRCFFDIARRKEFKELKNLVNTATNATYPNGKPEDMKKLFKDTNASDERFPNVCIFAAKTKRIDQIAALDEEDNSRISMSKFYSGCWAKLAVTPNVFTSDTWGTSFQQLYLNGLVFVRDDEPIMTSFTYEEMLGLMGKATPKPAQDDDEW